MRKLILALALTVSSAQVLAASVKITSFVYVNQERKVAELCGVVSDMTSTPAFVKIVVDERSKRPATYNTLAGADGKFCTVVVTYHGTADASAF